MESNNKIRASTDSQLLTKIENQVHSFSKKSVWTWLICLKFAKLKSLTKKLPEFDEEVTKRDGLIQKLLQDIKVIARFSSIVTAN